MFDHDGRCRWRRAGGRLTVLAVAIALVAVPAAAHADNVYVVNDVDNTVGQYSISAGLLSPLVPATVAIGAGSYSGIAASPGGHFVYVVYGTSIAAFSVAPVTGALSAGPVYTGSVGFMNIALSPNGLYLYAGASDNNSLYQFDVNPTTGALSPMTPASVITAGSPYGIAVTPNGASVYVADEVENVVSQYDVNPTTGALSPMAEPTVPTGTEPLNIAVAPNGLSAYVTDPGNFGAGNGMVSQYGIDPSTGALTALSPALVPSANGPDGLAVSPDGKSLYVTALTASVVSQYDIDPSSGALSAKTPATVPSGQGPVGIAISPDGTSVYVADFDANAISQYAIAPSTETLSPLSPATVAAGQFPNNLVTVAVATKPVVTAIAPASGSQLGGTSVTITGSGFTAGATVSFGTAAAASVTVQSPTSITAISPPGSGTVDVTVTTAQGTSQTSSADQFTYTAVPLADSLSGSYILDSQLWQRINLPAGSTFTGSADLVGGSFTGEISVPPFASTLYVLGFPNTLQLTLTPTGPVSGTVSVTGGTLKLSATASLNLTVTLPGPRRGGRRARAPPPCRRASRSPPRAARRARSPPA